MAYPYGPTPTAGFMTEEGREREGNVDPPKLPEPSYAPLT